MRKCAKKWTQKDGKKIRICDMSDQHLGNTIEMLRRYAEAQHRNMLMGSYAAEAFFTGELAQFAIEDRIEALVMDGPDPSRYYALYDDLVEEQHRRDSMRSRQQNR